MLNAAQLRQALLSTAQFTSFGVIYGTICEKEPYKQQKAQIPKYLRLDKERLMGVEPTSSA
ncbi:hypothetical protein, partial [uncultured Gemmiger sp.]|uniref:hypothetical protein n=1 Tax=uncultured Gemmiger sp. TaxID=1623490 RepID=UPI0025E38863